MTFAERLKKAMEGGNLTIADLHRWFEVPYQTVRGWLNGHEPGGGPIDSAYARAKLISLEKAIIRKRGLPLPRLWGAAREAALIEARDRAIGKNT